MKKWKYIHYDLDMGGVALDQEFKTGIIWATDSPGPDYEETSFTFEEMIAYKASLYPTKEEAGKSYSNIMNARLDSLTINYFQENMTAGEIQAVLDANGWTEDELIEEAKDQIDTKFAQTQLFLEGGKLKSAQREMRHVVVDGFLDQTTYDEIKVGIDLLVQSHYN